MSRLATAALCAAVLFVGGLYAWARIHRDPGGPTPGELVILESTPKHLVTKEMADASRAMVSRPAPPFVASALNGDRVELAERLRRGPVVLTFIKAGCPCSEAAQPFFNQLDKAYPGVEFLGVVDVEGGPAQRWAERLRIAYPMLTDPDLKIVRDYGVENSAYVVVIDRQGRIVKHWPGYSTGMLRELGATLAALSGTAEQPLDVSQAPDEEYSGCPFDL
ncbi:peroxiredoxin family protein [Paludisphaera rhizosphaerae]|uniref:peroxiredoxin family protein n=1 Tax=Paludisphaera rhizosphaerae TaxID=2711216 RepID=UPI0013EC8240|nr:redoxin domain-containing protein [Paludisphaera rhizosphaerae]